MSTTTDDHFGPQRGPVSERIIEIPRKATERRLKESDVQLLRDQGWQPEPGGWWIPPTSYRSFPPEKAIKIARHPSFRFIVAMMD